ncbi:MAG: proline--tRNA ligase [Acidobacteriota bacterium]|nr:proline--tRNA ligase [Blastocatellia bacterium]MDW8411554.1 proline--tRNA ligase [Acidobacteriota bacterium]
MRWSRIFIPTLRENPATAEATSHRLLLRAGYIRQLTAGVYSYLPLAQRVLLKITDIIREEMNRIGAQEFLLPALNPAEVWKESGRWEVMGENMFRLKDRKGADLCLGMTHEEVFTAIARDEIRSYKQLPQIWYQIQTKFRDEARPKSGILRVREFIMKDSYSFDVDWEGLDKAFEAHREAYCRIYDRCGLKYLVVEASSGAMGGSQSSEFMVISDAGEDWVVFCASCGYAANIEKATSRLADIVDESGPAAPEEFPTPGVRTIEDLTTFPGGASADRQIKTLVYMLDNRPHIVLLRGDHQLNETKLTDATAAKSLRPAHPEEIKSLLGAFPGSLGAVGVDHLPVIADYAIYGRRNMTTGANRDDFHLRGVDVERDIKVTKWADLRNVASGERCLQCNAALNVSKAIEVGHIFKLGTRYSESMGATVLTAEGKEVPIVMGSYGIGVGRIMASAVELYNDEDGICWPVSIAPFEVVITPANFAEPMQQEAAVNLYKELSATGVDVLLDDRDERPGVKFKDADLIGIPFRLTIGKKLKDGKVELFERKTRSSTELDLDVAVRQVRLSLAAAYERSTN